MSVVNCYPMHSKAKSVAICQAFARGCRGEVVGPRERWLPEPSFFYGISDENQEHWAQALLHQDKIDWYYSDNSYFDKTRGTHFRVTKNRLQHTGLGTSDGSRFASLGIEIKPWRTAGKHIVVCPQSDDFMRRIVGYNGNWLADTTQALMLRTERPLKVRHWQRDKAAAAATLHEDLRDAWALVTWSSAAAIEAILAGIPAVVSGQCAAKCVSIRMDEIETADPQGIDRHEWAAVLADNQWDLHEIKRGAAWSHLNG
jgi:hypothetical protein